MRTARFTLILGSRALGVGAPATWARTPAGQTPAIEDLCDIESGAAFGLWNAYCEARDCHLANDGDPLTSRSAAPGLAPR